ncbi:TIGR01459 family HAD-type hydrolase (plasmid) [Phyllobacterium sp. 628]|uniref:TIGR01459 family HAD-type hydrolase n=1 Tax=Phyllobacterium sp. 628 TaxID=2718938 RepID=UPI0016624E96|nr:TIGR01459 family HAD-type hydrolase [Phyllobacterium sp. 628]QND54732.1 TIGR01459 family HAD-type hydrolase [Phyllobacterium sp. 628]
MHNLPEITSLDALSLNYDVFLIDQFGVLRDGEAAYPGAIDALAKLKAKGSKIVILSNSGRSGAYNAERLVTLGFSARSFDYFVTSGDVASSLLKSVDSFLPGKRPSRIFTISSGQDNSLANALDCQSVSSAADADLIIISGSETERISLDSYREILRPAASRGIPCVCTNPDRHKLLNGDIFPSAGALAEIYEDMGGLVTMIGKPYRQIYEYAIAVVGSPPLRSVVAIGDSLGHDIAGARSFGLNSALTRTGVHAHLSESQLFSQMESERIFPNYILPAFVMEGSFKGGRPGTAFR